MGSQYSYQVQATYPEGGSLTYQLLQAPMGMAINPTTGLLTWNNPTPGNHTVVVGAADAGGLGAAQGFTLIARANSVPVVPTVPVQQSVAAGATYRFCECASVCIFAVERNTNSSGGKGVMK